DHLCREGAHRGSEASLPGPHPRLRGGAEVGGGPAQHEGPRAPSPPFGGDQPAGERVGRRAAARAEAPLRAEERRPRGDQAEGDLREAGDGGGSLRGRGERHPDGGAAARVNQGRSSAAASTFRDFSSCTKAMKRGAFHEGSWAVRWTSFPRRSSRRIPWGSAAAWATAERAAISSLPRTSSRPPTTICGV